MQGASFAGLLLAVVGGVQMIARYVCGVWADRVGKPGSLMFLGQGLVIASLVGMVGIISGGLPLGWLLVSATLFGCGFGLVSTEAMLEMFMRVPRGRIGQASTVWNAAFDTGTGSGAILLGLVAAWQGYTAIFLVSALVVIIGVVAEISDRR